MQFFLPILQQIAIMFIIILLGYILFKCGVITPAGRKQLSEIVLTIVCPALLIMVFQIDVTPELVHGILWSFLLSAISIIVSIIISDIIIPNKGNDTSIKRTSIAYTNCAFMGIPLIVGLYGDEGVIYLTAYIAMFNLLVWTHGAMAIKGEKSLKGFLNVLKSPTIIALILAILCFATGFRIPKIPATALNYIKEMNTPLAMLVAGATMAESDMLSALKKKDVMIPVLIKLIFIPIVVMLLYMLLPINSEKVFIGNIIATACPTATIVTLFSLRYGKNASLASEIFAVSTLLSGISLPFIVTLCGMICK